MSVVHLYIYSFIHYNLCASLDEILAWQIDTQQSVSSRASAGSRMSSVPNVVEQRSGTLQHLKAEWEDAVVFFLFLKERHQREEGQTEEEWKVCIAPGWGRKNQSITSTMIETIKTRQLSCEIKSVKHFQSSRCCYISIYVLLTLNYDELFKGCGKENTVICFTRILFTLLNTTCNDKQHV